MDVYKSVEMWLVEVVRWYMVLIIDRGMAIRVTCHERAVEGWR